MNLNKIPARSKTSMHYRKIAGRNVYVKATGAYEYEISVDNSFPVIVQLHKPETVLNLVEDTIRLFSSQLNLKL